MTLTCFEVEVRNSIATVRMARDKVNAIDPQFVREMSVLLEQLRHDPAVRAVILTGRGRFFSFGLDIPAMYDFPREDFTAFITRFCSLYAELFLFPKPVIGAINGHAIAGGLILALACDYRVMVESSGKVALNEVTFGASLFAGAVEMLRFAVGNRHAEQVLLHGTMYPPDDALKLGIVDATVNEAALMTAASTVASARASLFGPNFASLKLLVRKPVADAWLEREPESIREWIDIWYSPQTRELTKSIQIRP